MILTVSILELVLSDFKNKPKKPKKPQQSKQNLEN